MTKEYGVTHFTELHRILHKYFLIWRCQIVTPSFYIRRIIKEKIDGVKKGKQAIYIEISRGKE